MTQRYQLSERNYSQRNDDPIKHISREFDTENDAIQFVRENLLGHYNYTVFENQKEFDEQDSSASPFVFGDDDADFPAVFRDDGILIKTGSEPTNAEIFGYAESNEHYLHLYDLHDINTVKELYDADFFETDKNGVFSLSNNFDDYYYFDDNGRFVDEYEHQCDDATAEIVSNLYEVFGFRYYIATDIRRQHDDRTELKYVGLDYINTMIFCTEAIIELDCVQSAFDEFINQSQFEMIQKDGEEDVYSIDTNDGYLLTKDEVMKDWFFNDLRGEIVA